MSIFFDKTVAFFEIVGLTLLIRSVVMVVMCGYMLNVTTLAVNFSRCAYHFQLACFYVYVSLICYLVPKLLVLTWSMFEGSGAY